MAEFWSLLAAAVIPAAAALIGVAISNRNQRSGQRELLREEALTAQRDLVVGLVVAGTEWAERQQVMVPMMSRFSTQDMMEFVNTDSGRRLGEVRAELHLALTRARLFLVDEALRESVAALSTFMDNFAETVNGPILENPGVIEHVGSACRGGEVPQHPQASGGRSRDSTA